MDAEEGFVSGKDRGKQIVSDGVDGVRKSLYDSIVGFSAGTVQPFFLLTENLTPPFPLLHPSLTASLFHESRAPTAEDDD